MALDPRIVFGLKDANVTDTFRNVLTNLGEQQRQEQSAELQPFRSQLLQAQAGQAQDTLSSARNNQKLKSVAIGSAEILPFLQNDDIEGARATLLRRRANLVEQGLPTETTDEGLSLIDANPQLLMQRAQQGVQLGQQLGFFSGQQGQTAGTRELNNLLRIAQDPNSTEIEKNSALVQLGQRAPTRDSAIERISTDKDLREDVISFEGEKAGATEGAKQIKKLKFAPQIARDVAKAKQEVEQRGAVFTELNQAEAALPGLENVVSKLKVLSGEATFTLAGRVFDSAGKELFGVATKGATARDKMTSLVSNQVLPLLKPIFGSQFTEREGDRLIAAFADVNSTPESRRSQLDSFLDQMKRNIASKQRELQGVDADTTQQEQQPQDFGGFKIISVE